MPKHLQKELERLKNEILMLGEKAQLAVHDAAVSIDKGDAQLAKMVIDGDIELDDTEIEIEEDCLKILALHQPVAIDLRFIVAVLKINNDLERIGDLAVNIAERSVYLAGCTKIIFAGDIIEMAKITLEMLKDCLDALVNLNSKLAQNICKKDDIVDDMNKQMYLKIQKQITETPEQITALIHLLSVSRHLERIADHATNIAEDIIYMVDGNIIRHRAEEYK